MLLSLHSGRFRCHAFPSTGEGERFRTGRTVRNVYVLSVVASKAAKIRVIAVLAGERKQPHLARVSCYVACPLTLRDVLFFLQREIYLGFS